MAEIKVQAARLLRYGVAYFAGTFALLIILASLNAPPPGPLGLVPVWALLCAVAAYRREMVAWAVLCLTPLAIISVDWLSIKGAEDPFGMRWWHIQLFTAASLVTAATGILTLIARPALRHLASIKG